MISAKTGLGVDEVLEAIVHRLPAPTGDAEAPLQALLVDPWYDPYLGVVTLVRVKRRHADKGQKIRFMGTGAAYQVDRVGVLHAQGAADRPAGPGRGRLHHRRHQGDRATPGSATPSPTTASRRTARCPASARPAGRVLRHVPDRRRRLREPARQPGQAAAQRRQLRVRAREQLGPGPRLPLRLPGSPASGDHPGAARARVRPRPRSLPRPRSSTASTRPTATTMELHNPADYPDPTRIDHVEEPWIKATILVPDEFLGGDPPALHRRSAASAGADLCRQPRDAGLPPAAERGRLRLLRPAEVDQPRLCQLRLPRSTATARATWSSWTSWSTATGSTPVA